MSGRRRARAVWALPALLFIVVALIAVTVQVAEQTDDTDDTDDSTTSPTTSGSATDASIPAGEVARAADSHGSVPVDESRAAASASSEPAAASDAETPSLVPTRFVESFDGAPSAPTPWSDSNWDVTIHSRNVETFDRLEAVEAMHGPNCEGPPATHTVTAYPDAVYQCRDHMMTAINASGYGMIYVTPNRLVDFSDGAAVIKVDVSTLRTSQRDWWDIWISPYDEHLQLPLDLGSDVDVAGPPRNAVRIGIGTENQLEANIYRDFVPDHFDSFPDDRVPGELVGYETILQPDPARRDTFEIQISRDHLKVGMPAYDFWWIDADIEELGWDLGVVQFGHHSYTPSKDCNIVNNPTPRVERCQANTWHWDNVVIEPAIPFTIVQTDRRTADPAQPTVRLERPAPAGAMLRFTGIGNDIRFSVDGGPFVQATPQATFARTVVEHFTSYWVPIPEGATTIEFAGDTWFGGDWLVRSVTAWSRVVGST